MSRSRRARLADVLTSRPLLDVLERLGRWRGVLTFNYHRVGDSEGSPWDRSLWSASADELDRQLATLARHAEVIAPADVGAAMQAPRGRRVLITFDDGYRDNYEIAFPLLRRHGLSATFFLASGFIDDPHAAWWDEIAWMVRHATVPPGSWPQSPIGADAGESAAPPSEESALIDELIGEYKRLPAPEAEALLERIADASGAGRCPPSSSSGLWMTWAMAREMLAGGMSIGGHTVTHPVLARLTGDRQREEIRSCAERLAAELGIEMRWFAYPVGSPDTFTTETEELLREAGVELAFSFYGGFARPAHWREMDVPRIHVGPGLDEPILRATLIAPQLFARG
jgi:peptidoglycan/xylan/chitin deacetylase (PgdA/CDA1 family)